MKKCVVLGVTGGIAAYKACEIIRELQKNQIDVFVIMTPNATQFVSPLTFETLSLHPVAVNTFTHSSPWEIEHISLAQKADLFMIVPATANIIAKMAAGIADDMLSTTVLATHAPVLIAPAMNTGMYLNKATESNIKLLKDRGIHVVTPANGHLACGDSGIGKLESVNIIVSQALQLLYKKNDLEGLRILVTAGPTREMLDPVRYITNRSSGKMGYAIAQACVNRGGAVTLLSGPVSLSCPHNVDIIHFLSTEDLLHHVTDRVEKCDILIQAAAPSDYRPAYYSDMKIKKENGKDLSIQLIENPDVAAILGKKKKKSQTFVGFAAETENILENAQKKLRKKNLDMIVANDVLQPDAGFDHDTNIVTIISANDVVSLPKLTKYEVANQIIDSIVQLRNNGIGKSVLD